MFKDDIDKIYMGYPTEDNYRKNLIKHINKTKFSNMKDVSTKLGYALSPYDLIRLANEYKKQDKTMNEKIEYLLTDINFHSECAMLMKNKEYDLIEQSKLEIRKLLENYVLNKFITEYKVHPEKNGYISGDSKELEDVSYYDCKYLQNEGYLRATMNGYELTDDYKKTLKDNQKKFKYVHWLKIDSMNETQEGKEWLNLKEYKDKYDCNMTVFYYNNNFDKIIKLECNQSYEELDMDVNSMFDGSLIRLKSKPKNITVYNHEIEYFFNNKIKYDDLTK